jgi:protein gp37
MVFVNSMSDLFHPGVPDDFILQVFLTMAVCQRHTFQVLTKRPERMAKICAAHPWFAKSFRSSDGRHAHACSYTILPNVWLGTSIENQKTADERTRHLRRCPAAVRFLSIEPMLGPISAKLHGIHWVIVGGESGPGARPMHPDWARQVRDDCAAAGVPFFFKQWGAYQPGCQYYEEDDRVRERHLDAPHVLVTPDGAIWNGDPESPGFEGQPPSGTWIMHNVGKKAAGRTLDGRLHDGMPERVTSAE